MKLKGLTPKQKRVLDFITKFYEENDYAPSLEEIARHFKRSIPTIYQYIKTLEAKGFLKKEDKVSRGIKPQQIEIEIPLFGFIAAGEPIEAIPNPEPIRVPKNMLGRSGLHYALKVKGDSMVDEGIYDGDTVIIRRQETAENGQRVVALIDNNKVTLKKLYRENGRIRLQPANPDIKPIYIDPSRIVIQGIIINVIKSSKKIDKSQSETTVVHTLPIHKRPKGGSELVYPGKLKEEDVICDTKPARLEIVKQYGDNKLNKLILGDSLGILKSFYDDRKIRGKIGLVYIDPPFGTGQDFVGYDENNAYSDRLVNIEFLEFLRKRLIFLKELLSENGSIYLHIDQKIGHYVKIIMDEVFGEENFRNDITRIKCNPKNFERKAYGNIKDVVYFYSKSKPNSNDPMYWSDYRLPLSEEEIIKQFPKIDKLGRQYATTPLHAKGKTRNGPTGKTWKGLKPPKGRHWRYDPAELTRLDDEGLIEWSPTGNPRKIIYANETRGRKIQDVWDFKDPGFEKSLYPTEKNEEMLRQIILASSKEGDTILDCFAGSGTTLVGAEKLNRNWIGIDNNKAAVEVAEKRLLVLDNKRELFSRPMSFSVYRTL